MTLKKDSKEVIYNKSLIRRRFYLSKESLDYISDLAITQDVSPSILLDSILLILSKEKNGD